MGRDFFVGGGVRRNNICVSGSAMVGVEAQRWRGPCHNSGAAHYYYLLFLYRPGRRHTLEVAYADAKSRVGTNIEEVK